MGTCIEWQGNRNEKGYGRVYRNGKQVYVHRYVFELYNGYKPDVVMHTCDNPSCYNVHHLVAGTQQDNLADMYDKGRHSKGSGHYNSHLTEEDVKAIRASEKSCKELGEEYKTSRRNINQIRNKRTWKHV